MAFGRQAFCTSNQLSCSAATALLARQLISMSLHSCNDVQAAYGYLWGVDLMLGFR